MAELPKLEDCPFCSVGMPMLESKGSRSIILCWGCGIRTANYTNDDAAIAAWNRRPPAPTASFIDADARAECERRVREATELAYARGVADENARAVENAMWFDNIDSFTMTEVANRIRARQS